MIAALMTFKRDSVLQGWGFRAVRWMARGRPTSKKVFLAGGAVQMACCALSQHADDIVAQAWACGAMIPLLGSTADDADCTPAIAVAGSLENVAVMMSLLSADGAVRDGELLELVWSAIHQLACQRKPAVTQMLLNAGILERLSDSIGQTAPSFGRAVAVAIRVAGWLAMSDPSTHPKLRMLTPLVVGATEVFRDQKEKQAAYDVNCASQWLRLVLVLG